MDTTKNKESAYTDFIQMIEASWTYGRLTDAERGRLENTLKYPRLFGSYNQRWETLQALYHAFIMALGYDNNFKWRDPDAGAGPLF